MINELADGDVQMCTMLPMWWRIKPVLYVIAKKESAISNSKLVTAGRECMPSNLLIYRVFFFFEKGLDPIYLVHPGFYRKHPGEDKKYNKLHSIQTPGV